jgi:Flp pilus assembly protein TadG
MVRPMRARRRGVAAVELAFLLPFLVFLFVIAVDWSRIYYTSMIVENCARNGALFAADPFSTYQKPYPDITTAALADAPDLSPPPTVTTANGTAADGTPYVDCTVSYTFQTISNFPGVPSSTTITRTVRVYQAPALPSNPS